MGPRIFWEESERVVELRRWPEGQSSARFPARDERPEEGGYGFFSAEEREESGGESCSTILLPTLVRRTRIAVTQRREQQKIETVGAEPISGE